MSFSCSEGKYSSLAETGLVFPQECHSEVTPIQHSEMPGLASTRDKEHRSK